jgi:glycosyltransferase involved in cell wall biosynthesis
LPRTAIIIPAFNEATRIAAVLEVVAGCAAGRQVWVIDDGSTDDTSAVAQTFAGVQVLRTEENHGKGAAMWAGVAATDAELLVFLDADLRGLRLEHVDALVKPVAEGAAEMSIGLFRGGRGSTDFSHVIAPWVSGQRAIRRDAFLTLDAARASRQGIELLLTRAAREQRWRVVNVPWQGVTHAMKEEKLGLFRGHLARWKMYGEILRTWTTEALHPTPSTSAAPPVRPATPHRDQPR